MYFSFIANSILLGVGLAMDAFSVSIVNGMKDPDMKKNRKNLIAGTFAFFQFAMPLIGWFCVHSIAETFTKFQPAIPWIALILLLFIGGKMLIEGIRENLAVRKDSSVSGSERQISDEVCPPQKLDYNELLIQGIATSIDALSVGFTIASYNAVMAILCSLIIAVVTFIFCRAGLALGFKFGEKLSKKAPILGGVILIFIGLEIFFTA